MSRLNIRPVGRLIVALRRGGYGGLTAPWANIRVPHCIIERAHFILGDTVFGFAVTREDLITISQNTTNFVLTLFLCVLCC